MSDQNIPTNNAGNKHTIYVLFGFLAIVIGVTTLLALAYAAFSKHLFIQLGLALLGLVGVVAVAYFGFKYLLNSK